MLHKLEKVYYVLVRPLFSGLEESQPMCTAVLDGIYPGSIYTDDLAIPRTAYLQTYIGGEEEPQWGFLAGDPQNESFNQALQKALFGKEIIRPEVPMVMFTCHPQDWGGQLAQVFGAHAPIPSPRRHYVGRQFSQDWHSAMPDGYRMEQMNISLLQQTGLDLPDEFRQTLEKWRRMDDPRFGDYGFVLMDVAPEPPQIAAWATVDFVGGSKGDLGMFTLEKYRRRGFAYLVTAAAISHGLSNGLQKICWTCMEDNPGSIRTAEKLGLEREADYTLYNLVFNPVEHRAMLAYTMMGAGRYQEALDALEQIMASEKSFPPFVYYDAACARAILGDEEKAFEYLNKLANGGSRNLQAYTENELFKSLHGLPEWEAFLGKIRENGKDST